MCVFSTIIAESEAVGFVCILSIEDELDDQEFKIAKLLLIFQKQLEHNVKSEIQSHKTAVHFTFSYVPYLL